MGCRTAKGDLGFSVGVLFEEELDNALQVDYEA